MRSTKMHTERFTWVHFFPKNFSLGIALISLKCMQKGDDPGKFRDLDEILFIDGYPGYQQLLSTVENCMQVVCDVKGNPVLVHLLFTALVWKFAKLSYEVIYWEVSVERKWEVCCWLYIFYSGDDSEAWWPQLLIIFFLVFNSPGSVNQ